MNYQEFKQQIVSGLKSQLGSDATIAVSDILKNNDTHLDGLTILSPGDNLSPTIYLDYYYRQYELGKPFDAILSDILATYRKNSRSGHIDISFFTDYDKVKSRIILKLVNYERNRKLLSVVPHYRFLDLAVVFHCLLNSGPCGNATILIHNRHLPYWNITKDDLYALAMQNTPRLMHYDLRNMTEVLHGLFPEEEAFSLSAEKDTCCQMYVLSNQQKLYGSSCILYDNLLQNFANRLECDFYILPSSVHEVLLIPTDNRATGMELSSMVQDVNSSQLSREEILSDHVYYFSREDGQITM